MNMKPFNLERALAGDKVVTRDGREVTQIHFFDLPVLQEPIFAVMENDIRSWPKSGVLNDKGLPSPNDLFMAPKTVKRWVNFYENRAYAFLSEEEALAFASQDAIGIAVSVEFEEGYGCE